jgi:Ribosomal protein S13
MTENKQRVQGKKVAQTIVRISGKDIDGSFKVEKALVQIKGINTGMAHALSYAMNKSFGITPDTEIGEMSEEQIKNMGSVIGDPVKYGIPTYMLNNRKYVESGKDVHLVGSELSIASRQYITRDISTRTWRGYRHQNHLKVRGQSERSTGRTGSTVGVTKKKESPKKTTAAAGKK